jgi:hypothetical protein
MTVATRPPALAGAVDPPLDDALLRIAELTSRLHAVADLHGPRRTVLGARVCRACARSYPCPTVRVSR